MSNGRKSSREPNSSQFSKEDDQTDYESPPRATSIGLESSECCAARSGCFRQLRTSPMLSSMVTTFRLVPSLVTACADDAAQTSTTSQASDESAATTTASTAIVEPTTTSSTDPSPPALDADDTSPENTAAVGQTVQVGDWRGQSRLDHTRCHRHTSAKRVQRSPALRSLTRPLPVKRS